MHFRIISMEISGKVIELLDEQRGNGRNGEWRKQDFILETTDQYPKKVCISMWGDKIDQFGINTGDDITAGINVESREYNGRWYTDVKAWKVDKAGANAAPNQGGSPVPPPAPMDMPNNGVSAGSDDNEDLPF